MSALATIDDLRARFGAREIDCLLDQDGDTEPDTGRLEAALADATAEINARLALRWTLPLAGTAPWPLLTAVCCDLARHLLYDDQVPKTAQRRADAARQRMAALIDGTGRLVDSKGAVVPCNVDLDAGTFRAEKVVFRRVPEDDDCPPRSGRGL